MFYSLAEEDADLWLAESIKVLDEHFVLTANIPFERHLFGQLQQVYETVDQVVCRLRQKSLSCDFAKVDEAIRDQLIEKCRDARLRRKFLEKASLSSKRTINLSNVSTERHRSRQPVSKDGCYAYKGTTIM